MENNYMSMEYGCTYNVITCGGYRTNVQLYPTGVGTYKAIQCRAYWSVVDQKKDLVWIPKSQIVGIKKNDDGTFDIDLSEWYVSNVLKAKIILDLE